MFFVVDKPRLQRMIAIVREDKSARKQGPGSPFLRLAAVGDKLTVSSRTASATFPATVYEQGVLFIRTTRFRRILQLTQVKERFLNFQVTADGLRFCDVFFPFAGEDLILYRNPSEAPATWPPPSHDAENIPERRDQLLFPMDDEE